MFIWSTWDLTLNCIEEIQQEELFQMWSMLCKRTYVNFTIIFFVNFKAYVIKSLELTLVG